MSVLFDVVDDVSAVGMSALGQNNARVTPIYLFVVISVIVFEKNVDVKFSVIHLRGHGDVSVVCNWSSQASTCMCCTILLSHSHFRIHTLENF